MKHIYILFLLLTSSLSFAQIPAGYYNSASSTGYTLKSQLKKIVDNVDDGLSSEYYSIDNGYGGLYTTYQTSDIDLYYENNETMLDMYSEKPNGLDSYEYTYGINQDPGSGGTSEGEYYNREHIIPQSVFNSNYPMRSDAHFVVPSDKYVNAQRGNLPFGKVQTANYTSTNGSKRGNNLNSGYSAGYSATVFEPIDEFKGDIARMFFYFATRYEDGIASYNSYDMFDGSSNQVFNTTFFNILYQWHSQDPVSQREIDRNNAIFVAQNNRNPFIDHPEYVQAIWSNLLSNREFSGIDYKLFPNPVSGSFLNIKTSQILKIEIYDVLGKLILPTTVDSGSSRIDVSQLKKGIYLIKMSSDKGSITKKLIKQ